MAMHAYMHVLCVCVWTLYKMCLTAQFLEFSCVHSMCTVNNNSSPELFIQGLETSQLLLNKRANSNSTSPPHVIGRKRLVNVKVRIMVKGNRCVHGGLS